MGVLNELFVDVVNQVRDFTRPPPQPAAAEFAFTGVLVMALRIKVTLPPTTATDLASRELTYTVEGQSHTASINPANDPPFTFLATEGAVITGSLVDVNTKGFRSAPGPVATFTANDPAPPTPGAPVFEVVGKE